MSVRLSRLVVALAAVSASAGCFLYVSPDDSWDDGPRASSDAGDEATPNSGMQVVDLENLPRVDFHSVWVERPDRVYIAGADGVLLSWNGTKWSAFRNGSGVHLWGVWTSSENNDGYAVGEFDDSHRGLILQRKGEGWDQLDTLEQGLHSVWGYGKKRFAGGNDGALFYTSIVPPLPFGLGTKFTRDPEIQKTAHAPILWSIGGVSETQVVVAGDVATFYALEGDTWKTATDKNDPTRAFRAAWGIREKGTVLLGANYYGLWRRTNDTSGGLRRVELLNEEHDAPGNVDRYFYGIWGIDEHVVCVGSDGRVMTWDPEHFGRNVVVPTGGRTLYSVSGSSFDDVWMVGKDGLILHGSIAQ